MDDNDDIEFGMIVMSEDEINQLIDSSDYTYPPPHMVSGRNIKTGCYAFLLIAKDFLTDYNQLQILIDAIERIENITDSVAFNSLGMFYPLIDDTPEGILRLAETIIIIDTYTNGLEADKIPSETITCIENSIIENLEPLSHVFPHVVDALGNVISPDNLPIELQHIIYGMGHTIEHTDNIQLELDFGDNDEDIIPS